MTVRVVSEAPVKTEECICAGCGFKLEYVPIDLVSHRRDSDGDAIEPRGKYIVCPRIECKTRFRVKAETR